MANVFDYSGIDANILNRYPARINALLPTYYRFFVSKLPQVTYFCQSASLPGTSVSMVEMPTPFSAPVFSPSKMQFGDLTVSFIVDEELKNWLEIQNWMRSNTNVEDFEEIQDVNKWTSNATLLILNSAKNLKISVAFSNLFPISLSPIDFSSTIVDPEPFQASCTFSYRSYIVEIL